MKNIQKIFSILYLSSIVFLSQWFYIENVYAVKIYPILDDHNSEVALPPTTSTGPVAPTEVCIAVRGDDSTDTETHPRVDPEFRSADATGSESKNIYHLECGPLSEVVSYLDPESRGSLAQSHPIMRRVVLEVPGELIIKRPKTFKEECQDGLSLAAISGLSFLRVCNVLVTRERFHRQSFYISTYAGNLTAWIMLGTCLGKSCVAAAEIGLPIAVSVLGAVPIVVCLGKAEISGRALDRLAQGIARREEARIVERSVVTAVGAAAPRSPGFDDAEELEVPEP